MDTKERKSIFPKARHAARDPYVNFKPVYIILAFVAFMPGAMFYFFGSLGVSAFIFSIVGAAFILCLGFDDYRRFK